MADDPVVHLTSATLHWRSVGAGEPVLFIHGGGADLSYWDRQLPAFARHWRAVAYSRRYAAPNDNLPLVSDYSSRTDAADLTELIGALDLAPVHVVAHSIGGVAALFAATARPELFRSLVLAEPPVLRWARSVPGGEALWQDFMHGMWEPAAAAFRGGRPDEAMRYVTDYFVGEGRFDRLRPTVRRRLMRNTRDWEAFTTSSVPFPELPPERVRALPVPLMLLSAEHTIAIHALVDKYLAELLPGAEGLRVAGASHDLWLDRPEVAREATLAFLERHRGVGDGT